MIPTGMMRRRVYVDCHKIAERLLLARRTRCRKVGFWVESGR